MRFPFLAAEYTNICAFATFSKSSAVELLTEPKSGLAGGLRAPVRSCAGVSPFALRRPAGPLASTARGSPAYGCADLRSLPGPRDARRGWSAGSRECVHIPTSCIVVS